MRPQYRRRRPGAGELGIAFGVGVGVGLLGFYLTRTLLARDRLDPRPSVRDPDEPTPAPSSGPTAAAPEDP